VSYPDGILWKSNKDGSNPVQLTDPPLAAFLPRWSPDGTEILFMSRGPFGRRRWRWVTYIISSDGGIPQRLFPEGQDLPFATWSPDGHKISGTSVSPDGQVSIRIFDLDTHKGTDIPGSAGLFGPRWSPDGRYIAAENWDNDQLKIFDLKTQQWSQLPLNVSVDSAEWSSDGQFIYFRRVSGDAGVFRIRIHGHAPEKIVDLKNWRDAGWAGAYMGLDPTDAPLLLRDIGSEDIYALTLEQR